MRLQEMTAKRIELLGKLESARMQESVNKAMDQLTATVGDDAPTLKEVEDKIQQRAAMASAKAELRDATPEGAMVELEHEVNLAEADRTLDELRSELGLGAAPTVGTPEVAQTPPAGEIPAAPPAAPAAVEAPSEPATQPGEMPAAPVEAPKPPPSS